MLMSNESKMRETINKLAQKYREQTGNQVTHEQARKRIIKAITKKGE